MLHVPLDRLGEVGDQIKTLFQQHIHTGKGIGHLIFLSDQIVIDQDENETDTTCRGKGHCHSSSR